MASSFAWHGSWRRRVPGEGLGVVEHVNLGVAEPSRPVAPTPDTPAPRRRHTQVHVEPMSQDIPGQPAARPCGRMWLGG